METPVTVSKVESIQETIASSVNESGSWEVSLADPWDATSDDEFSVVNLYKNGGNDGEVNVLVNSAGEFAMFEYFASSTVKGADTVDDLVSYLNDIIAEK